MKFYLLILTAILAVMPVSAVYGQSYNSWMNDNKEYLNEKKLRDIIFPGSHDAGTGVFQMPYRIASEDASVSIDKLVVLSQADTEELAKLYNTFRRYPLPQQEINQRIANFARTQAGNVGRQLEKGSRYFDLRPYGNPNGTVHNTHTLHVQGMKEVFSEIKAFLDRNPNEIILLHERQNAGYLKTRYDIYWQLVMAEIGDRLVSDSFSPSSKYKDIVAPANGKRRIIYLSNYSRPANQYLWTSINGDVGWPGNGVKGPTLRSVIDNHLSKYKTTGNQFIVSSLTYTPLGTEYAANFVANGTLKSLHDSHVKSQIVNWMDAWYTTHRGGMNILMTDFIEENPTFVNKIIQFNRTNSGSTGTQSISANNNRPTAKTLSFSNSAPYEVSFEVTYQAANGTQTKWESKSMGTNKTVTLPFSDDRTLIVSLKTWYKDGFEWKIINFKPYNLPVKDIPRTFELYGPLLKKPSLRWSF